MANKVGNQFEKICVDHGQVCGMYCPTCTKFLCYLCYDKHMSSGHILHGCQIYQLITKYSNSKDMHTISKASECILSLINKTTDTIKEYFKKLLQQTIDPHCECELKQGKYGLSDQVTEIIKELSLNFKIKEFIKRKSLASAKRIIGAIKKGQILSAFANKICNEHSNNMNINHSEFNQVKNIRAQFYRIQTQINFANICSTKTMKNIQPISENNHIQTNSLSSLVNSYSVTKKVLASEEYRNASQNIIHYWSNGGNKLTICNLPTKTKSTFIFANNFCTDADSISYQNKIFIIGGNAPSDQTYEIDYKSLILLAKSPMLKKKWAHALCIACEEIYSIGGWECTWSANCQKYTISSNKWNSLPNLLSDAHRNAAFSFNEKEVYSLGGRHSGGCGYLNTIERLSIVNPLCWEIVNMQNAFSPRESIHAIQITVKDVLVFGGKYSYD